MKKIAVAVALIVSLLGCGGGGGSGDSGGTSGGASTPTLKINDVAGLYDGTVTQNGQTAEVSGMVSVDGKLVFISDLGEQLSGTASVSGEGVSISPFLSFYTDLSDNGSTVLSSLTSAGTASTTFNDGVITGTSEFGGINSQFTLTRVQELTDQGASLGVISGNYVTNNLDSSFGIDVDGILAGSDDDGCQYFGNVTIQDADINVYSVDLTVDNCGISNNEFTGLASFIPANNGDDFDKILLIINNGELSLTSILYPN
jgi:hypothetical protein